MSRVEMLAAYFVHDDAGWRLKGHAAGPMFRWMASWAVALRQPSDVGGSDDDYELPGLNILHPSRVRRCSGSRRAAVRRRPGRGGWSGQDTQGHPRCPLRPGR